MDDLLRIAYGFVILHGHAAREQVDLHLGNARHRRNTFFPHAPNKLRSSCRRRGIFASYLDLPSSCPSPGGCVLWSVYGNRTILSSSLRNGKFRYANRLRYEPEPVESVYIPDSATRGIRRRRATERV